MTPLVAGTLYLGGLLLFLIFQIWFMVVAARREVLWFLAVFFLPFVQLVFLFVEPKSIKPWVLSIVCLAASIFGIVAYNPAHSRYMTTRERITRLREDMELQLAEPSKQLEMRKARVRKWQQQLEQKKAALNPTDPVAQAAFDRELQDYLVELQSVKDAIASSVAN